MARELTLIVGLHCRGNLTHIISFSVHDSPMGKASQFPYFIGESMGGFSVPREGGTHSSAVSLSTGDPVQGLPILLKYLDISASLLTIQCQL